MAALAVLWKWGILRERFAAVPWGKEVLPFASGVVQLFSGSSTYRYLAGADSSAWLIPLQDGLMAILLLASLVMMGSMARNKNSSYFATARVLLMGGIVAVVGFFIVVGAPGLAPESARYGLWMIAPVTLLFSIAVANLRRSQMGAVALCTLLLAAFWWQYFRVFTTSGGQADPTFQTARTEPKQAALQLILQKQTPGRTCVIAASDWWVYWPIKYLAFNENHVAVLSGDAMNTREGGALLSRAMQNGDAWFVEFSAMQASANLKAALQAGGFACAEYSTPRADGASVLTILHPLSRR
jgi:hypothetical protein